MALELRALIEKKRDKLPLSDREIQTFVHYVVEKERKMQSGDAKSAEELSCQIGAMLMAIYNWGMDDRETSTLTKYMSESGKLLKWKDEWKHLLVDKHSTGGVGDKVSHVLVPVLAACGLKVPMLTGRSLEFTGGTLDKLESIPNFNANLTLKQMEKCLEEVGAFITGQTSELVPADKVLYHSRDITGTVNNIPLATGSILSKKMSEGISALVLDVKVGKSAFFQTDEEATELATKMVNVASSNNIQTTAFLTTMEAPIGRTIGNSLEIYEAIKCLSGEGPSDLQELVETLGAELLFLTSKCISQENGKFLVREVLSNGRALDKFKQILVHQGVETEIAEKCIKDPWSVLPKAKKASSFLYKGKPGTIVDIDGKVLAKIIKEEESKGCSLSYGVGMKLKAHLGDKVQNGSILLKFYHDHELSSTLDSEIQSAFSVVDTSKELPKSLIRNKISSVKN